MDLARLAHPARDERDPRSDRLQVPAGADQTEPDPVPGVAAVVAQQARRLVDIVDEDVDVAVVVEVADGAAARAVPLFEGRTRFAGRLAVAAVPLVVEQLVMLLPGSPEIVAVDLGIDMPVGEKEILPIG